MLDEKGSSAFWNFLTISAMILFHEIEVKRLKAHHLTPQEGGLTLSARTFLTISAIMISFDVGACAVIV